MSKTFSQKNSNYFRKPPSRWNLKLIYVAKIAINTELL